MDSYPARLAPRAALPTRIAVSLTRAAALSMADFESELHAEAVEFDEARREAYVVENHRHLFTGSPAISMEEVEAENDAADAREEEWYYNEYLRESTEPELGPEGCMCGCRPFTLTLVMDDPSFSMVTFP